MAVTLTISTVSKSGVLVYTRSTDGKQILLKFNEEKVHFLYCHSFNVEGATLVLKLTKLSFYFRWKMNKLLFSSGNSLYHNGWITVHTGNGREYNRRGTTSSKCISAGVQCLGE